MARIFFCTVPAVIVSAFFWLIHPAIGVFSFAGGFLVGWGVTMLRPERGEGVSDGHR